MEVVSTGEPVLPEARWLALGNDRTLQLEGTELWWVELPFLAPVATSAGTHRSRPLVLVHLRCRDATDGRVVDGWGECAALADTAYDAEDVAGAFAALNSVFLSELWSMADAAGGTLPAVGDLPSGTSDRSPHPLARSTVEMAVGDAHLRAADRSFAAMLGVSGSTVHPGAVIGLHATTVGLLEAAEQVRTGGYARIKAKVAPGCELDVVEALTGWADSVPGLRPDIQVDANGAYRPDQSDLLFRLDPFGLSCIEQPFDRDDLEAHRRLASGMITPISLDESLDGPGRVVEAVTSGACSVVCVKPARLGGIGRALETIRWCSEQNVPWWIGGMYESGYGRRVTTALATLPGPTLTGDLSLSSTYLARDVVVPEESRIDASTGQLTIAVDPGPGMGPVPEPGAPGIQVVARIDTRG